MQGTYFEGYLFSHGTGHIDFRLQGTVQFSILSQGTKQPG